MLALRSIGRFFKVSLSALVALALLLPAQTARAETVEIVPGLKISKRSYAAPVNQQPFFGFAAKTPEQLAVDEKFVSVLVEAAGSRQKAFDETTLRGWRAIGKGDAAEAARRFNQAFLLAPEQSAVFHGFAIVAMMRFNDIEFSDELFKVARKQPNPLKPLLADHGRALLIGKRPTEALPVLEQAVVDAPDLADAWSNLGFARLQNGDAAAACAAAEEAGKRRPAANLIGDLALLKSNAQCK
jgi:tetratricopeptide (TPR) repeat protein